MSCSPNPSRPPGRRRTSPSPEPHPRIPLRSRMTLPLRVLFASERAYIPDRVDGALYAAHSLLAALRRRGHPIEAVSSIGKQPARTLNSRLMRALTARRVLALPDSRNGYPTRRAWEGLV